MNGMDHDAVKSGAFSDRRRLAEHGDDMMNLVHRDRTARLVEPAVRDFGGGDGVVRALVFRDGHASEAAGKLKQDFGAVRMDPFRHFPAGANELMRIPGRDGYARAGMLLHREIGERDAGADQAGPAFRPLHVVIDAALVERAVDIAKSQRPDGRHHETVFQFELADLDRLE